jgi:NAD(P)-dependent dehydrogenase (short-subunit alcohol dehydrogenase family)
MVILLTGASRGIGAALAQAFTDEGHKVILVSRNRASLEKVADSCNKRAGEALARTVPFDLTDLSDLEPEFLSLVRKETDTIDALFNNAGQLINSPFQEVDIRDARRLFESNFFAPAQLIRICLPLMSGSGLKHVVNVTSMAGFQGSSKFSGLSYYSASKAALGSLTECLAAELKGERVKVNALAIGSVQTEMLAEAFPGLKAPLEPHEMARFMKWFTLEGGNYFNGKIIPVAQANP